jgi:group 2 glycosyl transferase
MKISIIVTCYNQEAFLGETLNSIAQQTYSDWECIIIDDGSTDNSAQIAKKWREKDSRFLYFFQENKDRSAARNAGIDKISGEFVQFLDGDDMLQPTKLEESITLFTKEKCDIVISNFEEIKEGKRRPPFCNLGKYEFTYENILLKWDIDFNIPIHCFIFSKKSIEGIFFVEEFSVKEDWVMWLEVFKRTPKVLFIDKPLAVYRIHNSNTSQNKELIEKNIEKVLSYILKNETLYFDAFFLKIINYYKEKIHKIQSRPWYKKVFYALIGKE